MVRARVYGILAGSEGQNDHDTLRSDPVFKLNADRCPDDSNLASQSTLSRFENAISTKSRKRLPEGEQVRFAVGAYAAAQPLVIDPVLSYSTYVGGSGVAAGYALAVDPASGDGLLRCWER